jgi:hypothetical protein
VTAVLAALRVAAARFGVRGPRILARLGLADAPVDGATRERLRADVPIGLDAMHPSWTGRLPPAAASPEPVRRWLRKAQWGMLVSMPTTGVAAKDPGELVRALERLGRTRLALALRAAPANAALEIAGRLGEHGPALLSEVHEATLPSRVVVRGAVEELGDVLGGTSQADALLFLAGARHVAPLLVEIGGDLGRQLAQRLPRDRGEILLAEMTRASLAGARAAASPKQPLARLEKLL